MSQRIICDQFGITAYLNAKADSAAGARPKPWGCRLGLPHVRAVAQPPEASHCNGRPVDS